MMRSSAGSPAPPMRRSRDRTQGPAMTRFAPLALFSALLAAPPFALAQVATTTADDRARTYTPDDFTRYSPRTALARLEPVPGCLIREAAQEPGLGPAPGNVLLNGQRLSGRSNGVLGQLGKIPAGNVVRAEIRDGATLDIPGLSGQVANVVTRAGDLS